MTLRVHGGVQSGAWFSAHDQVVFASLAHAGFLAAEEGVADSNLETAVELIQQLGSLVILQVEDGVALHICLDYAGGDLEDALRVPTFQSQIDALMGSAVTITTGEFRVA